MLVYWRVLTGAKRREWMGMGVAGMIITVMKWIIPENSLRLARTSFCHSHQFSFCSFVAFGFPLFSRKPGES